MKKFGKEVVATYSKYIDGIDIEVVVVKDEDYYNVHIFDEQYCSDELNTLNLQEPNDYISNPEEYFDKKYMIARLMEHFMWDKFYNEGVLSGSVEVYSIDKH